MMFSKQPEEALLALYRTTVTAIVRREGGDLTARQTAVLMAVYLEDEPQTVRGLAAALNVSKPAITRSIDKLVSRGLVVRADDPRDRRSVLIQRTSGGKDYMRVLGDIMRQPVRLAEKRARPIAA